MIKEEKDKLKELNVMARRKYWDRDSKPHIGAPPIPPQKEVFEKSTKVLFTNEAYGRVLSRADLLSIIAEMDAGGDIYLQADGADDYYGNGSSAEIVSETTKLVPNLYLKAQIKSYETHLRRYQKELVLHEKELLDYEEWRALTLAKELEHEKVSEAKQIAAAKKLLKKHNLL